jgi:hypothetical protein
MAHSSKIFDYNSDSRDEPIPGFLWPEETKDFLNYVLDKVSEDHSDNH